MNKSRILIVCPDASGLALLTSMLKSLGHVIDEAPNDRAAVRLMEREAVDLVLASVDPADADCLELLTYVRRKQGRAAVVLMFPQVHHERMKEASRQGASVLRYPAPAAELRATVQQALEEREQRRAAAAFGAVVDPPQELRPAFAAIVVGDSGLPVTTPAPIEPAAPAPLPAAPTAVDFVRGPSLIGADPGLRQILGLANVLATSSATVLIQGEPGSGKSELAHWLHRGIAGDRPFVTVRASELCEAPDLSNDVSERRDGNAEWSSRLARAAGGTLYIEEVGGLDASLQLQLLREIQLQDMEAASGRPNDRRSLVRLVISTSEDLASLVDQGRFRQDLFHRICSVSLTTPPLRHRGDDVELLAEHFRERFARQFARPVVGFSREALEVLRRHDWPGNVRELQGVVQRAVVLCHGPRISATHLGPILNPHRGARAARANASRPHLPMGIRPLKEALEEPEKQIIIQALQALNWNRQETARMLDINRTTLYKKMKKYGLLVDEPMWVD